MEEYPLVPSLTRASPTDTSIVPVAVRISFSARTAFTASDKSSCQKGSLGFGGPSIVRDLVRGASPSRRRLLRLLRGPEQGPPPGALTLTAFTFPSSSCPISNSTAQPSSYTIQTQEVKENKVE